ncbi:MAG TPA: type VI secretion system-associated FHA domain protein TagH [Albitalea sp.]|uniref:type VI secretion system-associated FHA domain protein TagH n=1 Tax=Piscinibacter sp. TaxID=1903157 RepID=UPI002ED5FF4D
MIAIRVVSRAGEAIGPSLSARFGEAGGDIGRAADCTLVLPDPERRISRKHVQVAWRGGVHFVRLISTNLTVELDGVPLAPGMEYPLQDGSRMRIGPFLLQTEAEAAPAPPDADVFGLFGAPGGGARPSVFHDLLHAAAPAAPAAPSPVHVDLVVGDPTGAGARPGAQATPADLVQALYAGLRIPLPENATTAQTHLVGALLRAALEGTLALLAARSIAKRELGASPTIPQSRANNPLKFSPNADAALTRLLGGAQRGFIPPVAALRDAFDDLRAHDVAVLAGMRAALEAVLARFDPDTLEARLAAKGMWDNLVPVNHRAKLWERYTEQHADMMREIDDEFDSLFGRAFLQVYEAQLARGDPPVTGSTHEP